MFKRLGILFSILMVISPCSFAQEHALSLSLQESIDLALKNNVDVLMSKAESNEAKGQQRVIDADLLPQIDAVASQERTWWENIGALGFPGFTGVIGPFNTFNAGIMVSQRILDLSALAHAQAGKIKWKASQLQIELAKQQVILATSTAYIQTLGYEQELASSYEDVRLAQHFLTLSTHQLDAGLASSLDVARDRTHLAQQEARQQQLMLNVVKSQLELKHLIKIPLSQAIELTDHLHEQNMNYLATDDAIATAQVDRMEMQVAHANSDYSLEELKASRRSRLPRINLSGEWGYTGIEPQKNDEHSANAMVSITLPIWEGGRASADIKEKAAMNEEQQIRQDDLNWKIEEDVRLALQTLNSTRAQMDAYKKVENFSQDELRLAQDRFSSGLGDNIQLIDAQVALADARDQFVQSEAQYNQAQLNYFAAVGHPRQFILASTS